MICKPKSEAIQYLNNEEPGIQLARHFWCCEVYEKLHNPDIWEHFVNKRNDSCVYMITGTKHINQSVQLKSCLKYHDC